MAVLLIYMLFNAFLRNRKYIGQVFTWIKRILHRASHVVITPVYVGSEIAIIPFLQYLSSGSRDKKTNERQNNKGQHEWNIMWR